MSAGVVNLQAQVESVLEALVKAATVELTRLFESRYRASAVDVGLHEDKTKNGTLDPLDRVSSADTKRSIGVQVDEDIPPQLQLSGPPFLSDGDCLREREQVKVVEGCLIPAETLLAEDNGHVDPDWSPAKEQALAENMDMVQLNVLETDFPSNSDAQEDGVLHISAEMWTEMLTHGSTQNSPPKQKPLLVQPDTSDMALEGRVKFVCPLILKSESPAPKPDSSEKPVQAEPKQGCVSTAKGTAYSPSLCDGAVTPAQVGIWERIPTAKETKNNLHMKLKLTSPDQKLWRPCVVQLVDVLSMGKTEIKLQDDLGNHITGCPLPKDLRRHQGLHTGHRLCCFTSCENGIWRLKRLLPIPAMGILVPSAGRLSSAGRFSGGTSASTPEKNPIPVQPVLRRLH
ncbi:hypothetical protein Q5P01_022034 [Channa striata]|uniref:Uncharacterized protein n=1 Tax=Channa striata TaxID=64152 RepID=A0AA88LPJ3_CHASR|nr:hypothetical protein Q5P01_022034 [Channa striata]